MFSQSLRQLLEEVGSSSRRIVCDPAKQNVAPALADPLERESMQIDPVASEAQWQNGDTEVHGGWWRRIFTKTLESVQPADQDELLECIGAVSEAKNVLIRMRATAPISMFSVEIQFSQAIYCKRILASCLLRCPSMMIPLLGRSKSDMQRVSQFSELRMAALCGWP